MIGCHYGTVNASGMNGLDLCKIANALTNKAVRSGHHIMTDVRGSLERQQKQLTRLGSVGDCK